MRDTGTGDGYEGLDRARRSIFAAFQQGRVDANRATARLLEINRRARNQGCETVGRSLERLRLERQYGQ